MLLNKRLFAWIQTISCLFSEIGCFLTPETVSAENRILLYQEQYAGFYTDASYSETFQNDTEILLAGILPEHAQIKAYPVSWQPEEGRTLGAYDITVFEADGITVYQPDSESIQVTVIIP
ncbi:MAG: hypothetical protein IJJ69_03150, partial [Oscillospiraceae bacterium]|nr:hypothetical protein [Oscillospiraceae bacterium]